MTEDQSVFGRRQIYYDQCGGETLICSDSEEELAEPEVEKHAFSEGEDQMLWRAFQEHELTQEGLNILTQFIKATSSEIQKPSWFGRRGTVWPQGYCWEGDVTVVMPATLAQYSKIIQNPSHVELQKAANQGRRCTWEKLSAIKSNCGIELALDECVALLNHMRRLKRSAERAASSHGHVLQL